MWLWNLAVYELTKFAGLFKLVFVAIVLILEFVSKTYAIGPGYNTCSVQLRDNCLAEESMGLGTNIRADLISLWLLSKNRVFFNF